jgi:23S rRNA pseudouridine1911/1915/1917 synthase
VHLKSIGHPLFADSAYGGDKILKGLLTQKYKQFVENCFELMPRQALHAQSLGFLHPTTRKEMFFESPLPADFQAVLEKWQNYVSQKNLV